jgi:hypothetical protein
MKLFITLLENVNKSRTSAGNLSFKDETNIQQKGPYKIEPRESEENLHKILVDEIGLRYAGKDQMTIPSISTGKMMTHLKVKWQQIR